MTVIKAPEALRDCKPQPEPPADTSTDKDLAFWVQDTVEAGADCREKMGRRNAIEDAAGAP